MTVEFDAAFAELTGHQPMRWQQRLFRDLVNGSVPDALDLPTGLGKTSVLPIWLIARAAGVPLPRRLVYVVDRRAVVDQATDVAVDLAKVLGDGSDGTQIVQALRDGLRLAPGRRLPISTLRGQFADNREWLESPAATAVVVGTVDMIGSRLLFEGYGVSARMRPVHAALLGADALLVLDEAHLVPPFEALLRSITERPRVSPIPLFRVLTLSATGRTLDRGVFRMTKGDLGDGRTKARLDATKRLAIEDIDGNLAERMADRAIERAAEDRRVIVFCDSRKLAQQVADQITRMRRDAAPALLVGARRVRERERLRKDGVFQRFLPGVSREATGPAFLVATSAGEVGVDLDADDLVCDLVPWERMVQRLGRVNRRATPGVAFVDVFVGAADDEREAASDADKLACWRAPFESEFWPSGDDGRREASPGTLMRLKEIPEFAALASSASTPEPLRPSLTDSTLDAWAMTSLREHPGRPKVEPWLRGWVEAEPQTRVVWRRILPVNVDDSTSSQQRRLAAFFSVAGPHLTEVLEAPTHQVVDALRKRATAWQKVAGESPAPLLVVLDSRIEIERVTDANALAKEDQKRWNSALIGRTVVVDAALGGLDVNGLLDPKMDEAPPTLDGDPVEWGLELLETGGFRVRCVAANQPADPEWPVERCWRVDAQDDDAGAEEFRVEVRRRDTATSGDPALARVAQGLADHHRQTGEHARAFAVALGLDAGLSRAIVAAAEIHDAGKARDLWQNAMGAERSGRPYAKTIGNGRPQGLQVNGVTYRHEFGSLRDAEHDPQIAGLPDELRELALHLVAAHHGFARPVIAALDPSIPPSAASECARAAALRFARLHGQWGAWGLAWLESLLRAADWAASRALNEES